jgi:hypothetical protein
MSDELREPDANHERDRSIDIDWKVGDPDDEGKQTLAHLRVYHSKAGVNYFSGTNHAAHYGATLSRVTEQPSGLCGGVMRGFEVFGDKTDIAATTEGAGRFNRNRLLKYADEALAELRERYANGDPAVHKFFATNE